MAFKAGNHLVSVAGENKPVYVWKGKSGTASNKEFKESQTSRRSLQIKKIGTRHEKSKGLTTSILNLQERQNRRDRLYSNIEDTFAQKEAVNTIGNESHIHSKGQTNLAINDHRRLKEIDAFSGPRDGRHPSPVSTLITEVDHQHGDNETFDYCSVVGETVRPITAIPSKDIGKHSKCIVNARRGSDHHDNVVHVSYGLDTGISSAQSRRESIPHRIMQTSRTAGNNVDLYVDAHSHKGTKPLQGRNNKIVHADPCSVWDSKSNSSSDTDDACMGQREVPMMKHPEEASTGVSLGKQTQRPASARAILEHHHRNRKECLLDEMRTHLHRRVRARREKSIIGDDIFQRQLKSGFWTSEVLYHQWGNDIFTMRNTWKENTSQEFVQSLPEEEAQPPTRLRSRRQAISVDRDRGSPLSMNTMTFMSPTKEVEELSRLDSRRRSSNLPAYNKERSYSVDQGGMPIRLDVHEDEVTRRQRLRALFKDTIIKVCRITLVMMHMIEASKASTYSGLMASLHFSKADGSDDPKNFNKDQYSRKYAELHVPRWAKQIAAKEPWERTPEEIIRLYGVMRNMRSFEKFTRRMRMEICRAARYNECSKGRVIVRQGHVGFNFYFIFSGSVFVQVDILDESTGVMTTSNVNTLTRGTCFGELALLSNGERTASVICRELTEIFEIEKETFLEVCPDIFDNELAEKIQVANELPFFKSWPEEHLRRLCFESPIQEIDFGKVVETNPGASEFCYVVLKGKVSLLKECDLVGALTQHCREMMTREQETTSPTKKDSNLESALNEKILEKLKALLLPEWTRNGKCHMTIGLMSVGHATDMLPIKLRDREHLKGVTLVSRGCRMMRVTKQRIEKMATGDILETFRQKHNTVLPTPSNEELFERFLVDIAWRHYRTYVTKASSSKLSRGADNTHMTKSAWLANYLVTNALLRDKRGRLAVKERLKEIQERHQRKSEVDEEEETEEESEEDMKRMVHLNKLKKGSIQHAFSKIEEACDI